MARLTEKQERFVKEYLAGGNATDAALKAGYSPKSAYSTGRENLKKPEVKACLEERAARLNSEKIADAQHRVSLDAFKDGFIIIKKGKKTFHKITL